VAGIVIGGSDRRDVIGALLEPGRPEGFRFVKGVARRRAGVGI
jgi:hypothetical protein